VGLAQAAPVVILPAAQACRALQVHRTVVQGYSLTSAAAACERPCVRRVAACSVVSPLWPYHHWCLKQPCRHEPTVAVLPSVTHLRSRSLLTLCNMRTPLTYAAATSERPRVRCITACRVVRPCGPVTARSRANAAHDGPAALLGPAVCAVDCPCCIWWETAHICRLVVGIKVSTCSKDSTATRQDGSMMWSDAHGH
jgi:hypothetical protein